MKKQNQPLKVLNQLFNQKKCWTISQLSEAMGYAEISVKRFLKQIGYYSSFTHNSKWYTLDRLPAFNKDGLWFYEGLGFSKDGNLKKTILRLIDKSHQGLSAKQLTQKLNSPNYAVLNQMHKSGVIDRLKTPKGFIYLSGEANKKEQQIRRLKSLIAEEKKPKALTPQAAVAVLTEFIKHPQASFAELSRAVAKRQVIATPEKIEQLFEEHSLKKTLN